jgi:putative aldouronate transport system substrate-binding protein
MIEKKQKVFVLCVILAMASIIAACSSDSKQGTSPQKEAVEKSEGKYDKVLSLKWLGFNVQGFLPKNGSVLQKKLESTYNVKIDNVQVDWYNKEQINVFLASGDSADYMELGIEPSKALNSGIIRPISMEMLQQYAPNILKSLDDIAGRDVWSEHLTFDGKLYGIPTVSKTYLAPNTLALRKDWLDAIGVTKMPDTLKELEELLLKFRNDDPDKNGKKDTYALSKFAVTASLHTNKILPYIFGAYGIAQNKWMEKEGKLTYSSISPAYKDALKTFQDWYKKEIFDPEVLLDDRAKFNSKFESNRLAGIVEVDAWLDPANASSPVGKLKMNKGIDMVYIPPVKGPSGFSGTDNSSAVNKGSSLFFGHKTTDEQVIRILQIQNDIFSDSKMYAQYYYGNEGEHWTLDDSGAYVPKPEATSTERRTEIGAQRFMMSNMINETAYPVRVNPNRRSIIEKVKEFPITKIASYQPDLPADKVTAMAKVESEFFWKAFSGQVDIDKEWDTYVENWMAAGGKQATDQTNLQYQAKKK